MPEIKEVTNTRDGQTIITEIKTLYYQAQVHAINSFIQIGQKLIELKDLIPHGQWADYIKENLDWNERKVQRFMQLAEGYSNGAAYANLISNPSFMSDLNMTNALALLTIPEDEVEEFAEEHTSEDTSNRELADEIRKYKEENTELSEQVAVLTQEVKDVKARAEEGISKEAYELVKAECDQLKSKLDKAKEKLKKEKESKEKEISKAAQQTMTEVEAKVREENAEKIKWMEEQISRLEEEAEVAERRAENANVSTNIEFKMYCDQMQNDFDEALTIIEQVDETDGDRAENMLIALNRILSYMADAAANPDWKS